MEGQQLEFDFAKEKPRQLSLVVTVTDKDKAKWIYDNHLNGDEDSGIRITAISNGDLNEKNTVLEDIITDIEENASLNTEYAQKLEEEMTKYESL